MGMALATMLSLMLDLANSLFACGSAELSALRFLA